MGPGPSWVWAERGAACQARIAFPGYLLGLAQLVAPNHVQDGFAFSLAQRQQKAWKVVAGDDALRFELEAPVGALGPQISRTGSA
jgi:hypothetical protein